MARVVVLGAEANDLFNFYSDVMHNKVNRRKLLGTKVQKKLSGFKTERALTLVVEESAFDDDTDDRMARLPRIFLVPVRGKLIDLLSAKATDALVKVARDNCPFTLVAEDPHKFHWSRVTLFVRIRSARDEVLFTASTADADKPQAVALNDTDIMSEQEARARDQVIRVDI